MPSQTFDSTSLKLSYPDNVTGPLSKMEDDVVLSYDDDHSQKTPIAGWNVSYEVGGSMSASFQKVESEIIQKEKKNKALALGFPLKPGTNEVVTGLEAALKLTGGFKSSQTSGVFAFSIKGDASVEASATCYSVQKKSASLPTALNSAIKNYVFPFQIPSASELQLGKQALSFEFGAGFSLDASIELSEVLMMDKVLLDGILPEGGDYAIDASLSASFSMGAEWKNNLTFYVTRPQAGKLRLQACRTQSSQIGGSAGVDVDAGVKDPKKVEKAIKALFEDLYEVPDQQWNYLVQKLQSGISYDDLPEQLQKPVDKLLKKYKVEYGELGTKLLAKVTSVRDRFIEIATLQLEIEVELAWKHLTEHSYLLDVVLEKTSGDVAKELYPLFLTGQLPAAYDLAKTSGEVTIKQYLEIFEQSKSDSAAVSVKLGKLFNSKRKESREVSYVRSFEHGAGTSHLLKGAFAISSEATVVNYSLGHTVQLETPKLENPTVGDLEFSATYQGNYTIGRNEFRKEGGAVLDDEAVRIADWLTAYGDTGPLGNKLRREVVRQLKQLKKQEFQLVLNMEIPDEGLRDMFRLDSDLSDSVAAQEFVSDLAGLYGQISKVKVQVKKMKDLRKSYRFAREALRDDDSTNVKETMELVRSFWFDLYREPVKAVDGFSIPGVIMALGAYYCQGLPRRIDLETGDDASGTWSFTLQAIPAGETSPLLLA